MAMTTPSVNNEFIKFKRQAIFAYFRETRFSKYEGTSAGSIIRVIKDLESDGRQINVPLIDQLRGQGVGSGTLSGREEALDDYGMPMWADWARHGVKWTKARRKDATFSIPDASTQNLNAWMKRLRRDDTIRAMFSLPTATIPTGFRGDPGARINGIFWPDASAAQRNAWSDANFDRVLYGNAQSNRVAGNAASSLANVDTTNDRLNTDVVSLAKFIAMSTEANKITPYMVESNGEEMYVMFVGSRAMRDLKNSTAMINGLREATSGKGKDFAGNPLFRAGDVFWDNVLVTEVPEIDTLCTLTGVGASSSNVVPCFLCGASALAHVVGQMPRPTQETNTDYDFIRGVGIEAQYGIGKVAKIPFGGSALKDWGMVTVFVSSV